MPDDIIGLWWETVTGPLRLIEQTAALLDAGKSVILQGAESIPWPEYFRDCVSHRVDAARFELLEWEENCPRDAAVPRLLEQLAPRHVNLCPSDEKRRLEYLKNERVLSGSLVWATSSEEENLEELIRFISMYRGRSLHEDGGFVVEVSERLPLPALSNRVETVRCGEFITDDDMRLFAAILAENTRSIPPELKDYAAHLTAGLAGRQAELVQDLLQGIKFEEDDPLQVLTEEWGTGFITGNGEMSVPDYVRHLQWKAQLQTAFPGIEIHRRKLIDGNYDALETAIKTEYWNPKGDPGRDQTGKVRQFGEEPEGPYDLELGTVVFMLALRRNDDRALPLLRAEDPDWRDRVHFLHKCRNKLAHHNVVQPDVFRQLMQLIRN